MKTIFIILIISIAAVTITACTNQNPPSITETVTLRDVTDKYLSKPNADEIYSLYGLSSSSMNGAIFRFKNLSDVSYNYEAEAEIEAQNFWTSNELDRIKTIKRFKNRMAEIITDSNKDTVGKINSSIYIPIATELNRLTQSKSDKKYLLVYSDLMENTADLSFYNKKALAQIQANPEAIRKSFEELQTLHNLNGIAIYLIYQLQDMQSDKAFTIISAFYKKLLEEKGATVTVSANINI